MISSLVAASEEESSEHHSDTKTYGNTSNWTIVNFLPDRRINPPCPVAGI
jgi:hypothetical protein